jgi:glycerol-3-phosphate dehydrogenase
MMEGGKVTGAEVRDTLDGNTFEIRAKICLNMTGPWLDELVGRAAERKTRKRLFPSKAMNIVVKKLFDGRAVGLPSSHTYRVGSREVKTGSRYLFTIPWRGHTLIGTTHLHYDGRPDDFTVTDGDIGQFLDEVNGALPDLSLEREDVLFAYGGLLPMTPESEQRDTVDLVKHYHIYDHGKEDSLNGLVSVLGVKYTTARDVSQKAVDHVFGKLGYTPPAPVSASRPLAGGDIEHFESFVSDSMRHKPPSLTDEAFCHLLRCYGTDYTEVLESTQHRKFDPADVVREGCPVILAQILYAVREEMAVRLTDVVMRRTELGSTGFPGDHALSTCAEVLADELGWDAARTERELEDTRSLFRMFRGR